jgi:hypothetical protein
MKTSKFMLHFIISFDYLNIIFHLQNSLPVVWKWMP